MHVAKNSKVAKFITSLMAVFALVLGGSISAVTPASATSCSGIVELVSDPVFYTGLSSYDANYIAYKVTANATGNIQLKVSSFAGGRVELAATQSDTIDLGNFATVGDVKYAYFLAKALNDTTSTAQTHDVGAYSGNPATAPQICAMTTTLNASAGSPAASSNNSNKVDSISVSGSAANVGDAVTVTVKGRTGTIGGSGRIAFAPTSYSTFPADKWSLQSTQIKLNQTSGWVDQGSTVTLPNVLYFTNQGANSGYYTASYVFKMIAIPVSATILKPIQYVESGSGLVYTGSMPGTQTSLQTASQASAATYTVTLQKVSGGIGGSATGSFTSLTQASNGASVSLPTNPTLSGYTFGGWADTDGGTTPVNNTYIPSADTTLYAIWTPVVSTPVIEPEPPTRKVTICHRTHSETNPYVRITVDYNAVNKKSGHQGHDEIFAGEHVFKAGIYKRAKDKDWGDIIPMDSSGLNRWQPLNWTALGAQIYSGAVAGCPSYDPIKYYNAQREAGVPEKKLKQEMAEIEAELKEGNPGTSRVDPSTLKYTGANSSVAEQENDKVTICHRTNSITNPYRRITVSVSSVTNKAGHMSHNESYAGHPVFDSTVTYPNNKKDWGDIIPADPTGKNRWTALNWTQLGQAIYNGTVAGCVEKSTQEIYNELRESGESKKEILKDLEEQKNIDDDPKDVDEVEYTGNDPEVKKTEPTTPVDPQPNRVDQSLSGIVWLDLNRDGLKDPNEPFLKNIQLSVVQLTSVTPSSLKNVRIMNVRTAGVIRPAAVVTVTTDANGYYLFPSLGAGDWKVVTGIPEDLTVTYDSQSLSDGEIVATVPVGSHAYTWVGLVGNDPSVDNKYLEEILKENPNALPLSELSPELQKKVAAIINKNNATKQPSTGLNSGKALAQTGGYDLYLLLIGVALLLSGLVLNRLTRTKRRNARY